MKIYGIFSGAYSDWEVHGYFTSIDKAFQYCAEQNEKEDAWYYGGYYPRELRCLDGERAPDDTPPFRYKYEFAFRYHAEEGCWLADHFGYENIIILPIESGEDIPENKVYDIRSKQMFGLPHIDVHVYRNTLIPIERAKKIAQDELYRYLASQMP